MARWKELPDALDQRVRQLVVHLRRLKDHSGLSLASLAAKTGYSRSSWERYLNGKALPPQHAVEELARVAGVEPTRLRVLHEVAEGAWQQRAVAPSPSIGREGDGGPRADDEGGPEAGDSTAARRPPEVRRPIVLVAVVAAALLGMGVGLLIALPWRADDGEDGKVKTAVGTPGSRPSGSAPTPSEGPGRYVFKPGRTYPCRVHEADAVGGGLSAGYSTTRTALLAGPGWDVVEAQCLLRYRKLEPGAVDGIYGQQTIAAVMRLQKDAGLPADGVVGPHTWQVLRG
ncbi:helix-turn-helix domain-containing protein [Streptomyces sp. NPDC051677]|uniref:helix-turn-helix domain-containing protein n=1 Tax=Streptomyces sp. NPDC051677 TaxID=3365669 RepID=UPI0037D84CD1